MIGANTSRRAVDGLGWKVRDQVYPGSKKPTRETAGTGVSAGAKAGARMVPVPKP